MTSGRPRHHPARRGRARELPGRRGRVTTVITKCGREIPADAVVIGAGVNPDVMLARGAGLELGESGGVRVNSRLETGTPGVFAAGDMAEYESVVHGGRHIRVEHWDVAFTHGKTAALNMLGKDVAHESSPTSSQTSRTGRDRIRRPRL